MCTTPACMLPPIDDRILRLHHDMPCCMAWCSSVKRCPAPAGGGQEGMDIGAYVHLYGREFVHTDVRLALEYYLAAARVQRDTPAARGRLLRELLTESRAYGAGHSAAPAAVALLFCSAAVEPLRG